MPGMCWLLLVLLIGAAQEPAAAPASSAEGQAVVSATPEEGAETLSPADRARRDELMKPGLELLRKGDAAGAYAALWPARKAFPKDLRVLRYSAQAAFYSGRNKEALDLFGRALAAHPTQPWPLHLAQMQVEARLGRWEEFDRELADLEKAKRGGADAQLEGSSGFLVDGFAAGPAGAQVSVQTVVFPLQADAYHTLYRFLLPKGSPAKTAIQAGLNSDAGAADDERCKNPEFRPYIDLESDDSEQESFKAAHPDEAANGGRAYSLDTYPGPCSQGLIKFYSKGEPTYEEVRADVVKALAGVGQGAPGDPAGPAAPLEPPAVAVPVKPAAPAESGSPVEPAQPVAPGTETAPVAPGTEVKPEAAEPVAPESPAKPPPQV